MSKETPHGAGRQNISAPSNDQDDVIWEDDDGDLVAACEEWESSTNKVMKAKGLNPPLTQIRNGYLWVSDLCSQMWCEQQTEYKLIAPSKEPESEQMSKGTELHLARELETQDYVDVKITSDEDIFAVKIINLIHALRGFVSGTLSVSREVPIFGVLGDCDTLFIGKIDEVNLEADSLQIVEFKTRTRNILPGSAQKQTHEMQVMVYKHLLDNLIRHGLKTEKIYSVLNLDGTKRLGKDVLSHFKSGFSSEINTYSLDDLVTNLNTTAKFLPYVTSLKINYTSQKDGQCFAEETVEYDQNWVSKKIKYLLSYWNGERTTEGVEIEDAWKCQSCYYADECIWRQTKAAELVKRNKMKMTS
jgi:exonuclease V